MKKVYEDLLFLPHPDTERKSLRERERSEARIERIA